MNGNVERKLPPVTPDMPSELIEEFGNNAEARMRIEHYALQRLLQESAVQELGDDRVREIWLEAMGDYKKGKGDVPASADPGFVGKHH